MPDDFPFAAAIGCLYRNNGRAFRSRHLARGASSSEGTQASADHWATTLQEGPEERRTFCFNRARDWNREHAAGGRPHPLPIHIMDFDIHADTPAVLLGTVEKLALIGHSAAAAGRARHLLRADRRSARRPTASRVARHPPRRLRRVCRTARRALRRGPRSMPCWRLCGAGRRGADHAAPAAIDRLFRANRVEDILALDAGAHRQRRCRFRGGHRRHHPQQIADQPQAGAGAVQAGEER